MTGLMAGSHPEIEPLNLHSTPQQFSGDGSMRPCGHSSGRARAIGCENGTAGCTRRAKHTQQRIWWYVCLLILLFPTENIAPNARHHPPRQDVISDKFSIKATLFAVGCMPLLGAASFESYKPSQSRNEVFKPPASEADRLPTDLMTKL
jgi:hypothetical protein